MKTALVMTMLLAAAGAQAQYPYPYGGPSQRGSRDAGLIDRVQRDLQRAASDSYLDGHDRRHFETAFNELRRFENNWSGGRFDNHALDKAIENIDHLAHADRVRPRDREMLRQDLWQLRDFRANRGGYYGGYRDRDRDRDDPYYRR